MSHDRNSRRTVLKAAAGTLALGGLSVAVTAEDAADEEDIELNSEVQEFPGTDTVLFTFDIPTAQTAYWLEDEDGNRVNQIQTRQAGPAGIGTGVGTGSGTARGNGVGNGAGTGEPAAIGVVEAWDEEGNTLAREEHELGQPEDIDEEDIELNSEVREFPFSDIVLFTFDIPTAQTAYWLEDEDGNRVNEIQTRQAGPAGIGSGVGTGVGTGSGAARGNGVGNGAGTGEPAAIGVVEAWDQAGETLAREEHELSQSDTGSLFDF